MAHLHGLTREKVIATLGNADWAETLKMRDAGGEFRIELQNTYPTSHAES
jgi:hypothetical protein